MKKLNNLNKELFGKLVQRIKQRRTVLSDIFSFLSNPNNIYELNYDFREPQSLTKIKKELKSMLLKLENEPKDDVEIMESTEVIEVVETLNLKDKLHLALTQSSSNAFNKKTYNLNDVLSKEIDIFINGGEKGYYLQKAFDYLLTVQPTSVESERCFSSSGFICNKFRSRLEDATLNALVFLKFHFQKNKI